MAVTIDQVTAQKFSTVLYTLAQQKGSKFAGKVRVETCSGYELAYFDTIAAFDLPSAATTRHGDTPLVEPEFSRRKVTPSKWDMGTMLDSYDLQRMQTDPQGSVVEGFANSFGRKKDDLIIAAAFGAASIGKTGSSSVASLQAETGQYGIDGTTGGVKTAVNTLPAASTPVGLELAKMLLMMSLFNEKDVDPDLEKFWAVTPTDIQYMLALTQVGSADYNTVKALAQGKMESFAGFNFFWTNRLTKDAASSTCWRTFAWARPALILAYIGDLTTEIDKRPDKKNEKQIYSKMDLGAVRMEGAMIHECLTVVV